MPVNEREKPRQQKARSGKYHNNFRFISNYYPINFTVADRYVFFNSLFDKPSASVGGILGKNAETALYGPMRNPTSNFRGKTNQHLLNSLDFLHTAALMEAAREEEFLNFYLSKNPKLYEVFDKIEKNSTDPYQDLLIKLNIALKNETFFKQEVEKEYKRIEQRRKIEEFDKAKGLLKRREKNQDNIKKELTTEEWNKRNALNNSNGFGDTTLNPYFNLDGSKIFKSIFDGRQKNFGLIAEKIIMNYGGKLFEAKQNKLYLNNRQLSVLIKLLIEKAYELLAVKFNNVFYKNNKETTKERNNRILKNLDELLKTDGELDTYLKSLLNSDETATALDSIANQYGIPDYKEISNIKNIRKSTSTLEKRLYEAYQKEKKENKMFSETFDQWRNERGMSDRDLSEIALMSSNIQAEGYYTNEGMALTTLIKDGIGGEIIGRKNFTEDYSGGKLIINFSYGELSSDQIKNIKKTEHKLNKMRQEAYKNLRLTSDQNNFEHNTQILKELRINQQQELEKLRKQLYLDLETFNNMIRHINIHGTVKGYSSIDALNISKAFKGASFGSNLEEQMGIIDQMFNMGGISIGDKNWLIFALVNCGNGMIGSLNKNTLEDYLSGLVGVLMFNDASLIVQDVIDYANNNYVLSDSPQDIHLYTVNNKYVPTSYILNETYKRLVVSFGLIDAEIGETHGTTVKISTYNPKKTSNFSLDELSLSNSNNAWEKEKEEAYEKTKLTMYFLANFLDLLASIKSQLSFI